ncbi:rRNA pseudouridine synthase [bacterium]|nr:rRNA pseudouridine synthase [bacterium]
MRLLKAIAYAGISSRRGAEELIGLGLVKVNGEVITDPAKNVDIETDWISVEGKRLNPPQSFIYILMNKPTNCVSTTQDEEGRETVLDLLKSRHKKGKLYPIGRLDYKSGGVIILTNDGDLTNKLIHPKYKVPKTYQLKVQGLFREKMVKRAQKGIKLQDGFLKFERIRIVKSTGNNTWLEVVITEGRNRILRRAFEILRFPILKLERTALGGLTAKDLKPGEYRFLDGSEVKKLREFIPDHSEG